MVHSSRKYLLAKLLALCAFKVLVATPLLDAGGPVSTGNINASLEIATVTWDNEAMQVTSVISVTADETPIPVYGTDMDQPTLPPDDTTDSIIIFTSVSYDVTPPPGTTDPTVLDDGGNSPTVDGAPSLAISSPTPASVPSSTPCPPTSEPAAHTSSPKIDPVDAASPIPVTDGSAPSPFNPSATSSPSTSSETPIIAPAPSSDVLTSQEPAPATPEPSPSTPPPTPAPGDDVDPRFFAAKTVYWDQRDLFIDNPEVQLLKLKTEQELRDLTLIQVQQVIRHGIRFPAKSGIVKIASLVEKLQTEYASWIPEWLRAYNPPYNVFNEGVLAHPGIVELESFGARTREAVGSALPTEFSSDNFVVQHTYESHMKDSATSYVRVSGSNSGIGRFKLPAHSRTLSLYCFQIRHVVLLEPRQGAVH